VDTPFIPVLIRYVFFRLRGLNLVISNGVKICGLRNIQTDGCVQIGMDYIGFMNRYDRTYLNVGGSCQFDGRFKIGKGCRFDIGNQAKVRIGKGGYINPNCTFVIMHGLKVGENCAISWGCNFLDNDFHTILSNEQRLPKGGEIVIGNHVWVGSNVTILKGVHISDNTVIAAGSVVTKSFQESNVILAGVPAKVIRKDVRWN